MTKQQLDARRIIEVGREIAEIIERNRHLRDYQLGGYGRHEAEHQSLNTRYLHLATYLRDLEATQCDTTN